MGTNKKFKLTDETMTTKYGIVLHRIECTKTFFPIKGTPIHAGEKGGWVECEENLSQSGNCWVWDNAQVYGCAHILNNAQIHDNARINKRAMISGNAQIYDNVCVSDEAIIDSEAVVYNNAYIYGSAIVHENARVFRNAQIHDGAMICGYASISDNAHIYEHAFVGGFSLVSGNAIVCGSVVVCGSADIYGDAVIRSNEDYLVFKNNWSSWRYFTWTKSNDMWKVGCFYGTGKELIEKAYRDGNQSKGDHYKLYVELVEKMKQIEKKE